MVLDDFPVAVGTAVLAETITVVLLGDQWIPMITTLQILAIVGLSRALVGTTGPLFDAVGRPDVVAKVSFARLVVLAVIIYPLTVNLGMEGSALAILLSALAIHGVSLYLASRWRAIVTGDRKAVSFWRKRDRLLRQWTRDISS